MGHVPDRLSALARATRAAGDLDSLLEVVVEHVASELGADGSYVGRLATDGTPATAQPDRRGTSIVWQSTGGNVYSVSVK